MNSRGNHKIRLKTSFLSECLPSSSSSFQEGFFNKKRDSRLREIWKNSPDDLWKGSRWDFSECFEVKKIINSNFLGFEMMIFFCELKGVGRLFISILKVF